MNMRILCPLAFLCFASVASTVQGASPPYETNAYVETIAGSGFIGHVDGHGVLTMFSYPKAITVDSKTNVFVWDEGNRAIRQIDADHNVTTLISNLYYVVHSMITDENQLLVLGTLDANKTLLWINDSGTITKTRPLSLNEGNEPHTGGLVKTDQGIFFTAGNRIYVYTNDTVAVFAGSGNRGTVDGQGIFCSFNRPYALAAYSLGDLYVGEGSAVRRVTRQAMVTTLLNSSQDTMTANAAGVIVGADSRMIQKVLDGNPTILGGKTDIGFKDGQSTDSLFFVPLGLSFGPDNHLYVADTGNRRIRRIVFDALPASQLAIQLRPTLILTGPIGAEYRIETQGNVGGSWDELTTLTLTESPFMWLDTQSTNYSRRFYRAVRVP